MGRETKNSDLSEKISVLADTALVCFEIDIRGYGSFKEMEGASEPNEREEFALSGEPKKEESALEVEKNKPLKIYDVPKNFKSLLLGMIGIPLPEGDSKAWDMEDVRKVIVGEIDPTAPDALFDKMGDEFYSRAASYGKVPEGEGAVSLWTELKRELALIMITQNKAILKAVYCAKKKKWPFEHPQNTGMKDDDAEKLRAYAAVKEELKKLKKELDEIPGGNGGSLREKSGIDKKIETCEKKIRKFRRESSSFREEFFLWHCEYGSEQNAITKSIEEWVQGEIEEGLKEEKGMKVVWQLSDGLAASLRHLVTGEMEEPEEKDEYVSLAQLEEVTAIATVKELGTSVNLLIDKAEKEEAAIKFYTPGEAYDIFLNEADIGFRIKINGRVHKFKSVDAALEKIKKDFFSEVDVASPSRSRKERIFEANREKLSFELNMAKFTQNLPLLKVLLSKEVAGDLIYNTKKAFEKSGSNESFFAYNFSEAQVKKDKEMVGESKEFLAASKMLFDIARRKPVFVRLNRLGNGSHGKGDNTHGKLLMRVRKKIKATLENNNGKVEVCAQLSVGLSKCLSYKNHEEGPQFGGQYIDQGMLDQVPVISTPTVDQCKIEKAGGYAKKFSDKLQKHFEEKIKEAKKKEKVGPPRVVQDSAAKEKGLLPLPYWLDRKEPGASDNPVYITKVIVDAKDVVDDVETKNPHSFRLKCVNIPVSSAHGQEGGAVKEGEVGIASIKKAGSESDSISVRITSEEAVGTENQELCFLRMAQVALEVCKEAGKPLTINLKLDKSQVWVGDNGKVKEYVPRLLYAAGFESVFIQDISVPNPAVKVDLKPSANPVLPKKQEKKTTEEYKSYVPGFVNSVTSYASGGINWLFPRSAAAKQNKELLSNKPEVTDNSTQSLKT